MSMTTPDQTSSPDPMSTGYPNAAAPVGTTVYADSWWRRNRWGVAALVPALALALAVPIHDAYTAYGKSAPRTPVTAESGDWVTYDKSQMRLSTMTSPARIEDSIGSPVTLPAGLRVWRATITFRSQDADALDGCDVMLTDTSGNSYDGNPDELSDLGLDAPLSACAPDTMSVKPPKQWSTVVEFLLPAGAKPAGIRVISADQLPRYAWLTIASR